jgi:cold shock CspA family protein
MDDEHQEPESVDKFYHGTIVKLHRGGERGTIRSASGKEIAFKFLHVTMVGTHRRFEDLREGLEVGYDVSWTSKGLRVSVIRIPD